MGPDAGEGLARIVAGTAGRVPAGMAATGKTWDQLCREAREGFLERFAEAMEDPDCPFARDLVYQQFPYGQDPLLNKHV